MNSPSLWRDYSIWIANTESYVDGCKEILKQIRKEAEESSDPEIKNIAGEIGSIHTVKARTLTKPLSEMMKKYKMNAESQFLSLYDDTRSLGDKLKDTLQEILLRRDYILYTCRLCPGQIRQLR